MLDGEVIVRPRGREDAFHDVFRVLDLGGERVEVVLGVEVKVDAVVAQGFHIGLAAGLGGTIRVGRSHVGWVFADYVGEGTLVFDHLLLSQVGSGA